MKRDLLVGVAQRLSAPGEPRQNLSIALGMIEGAAARGVELLVLPELWSSATTPRRSPRMPGTTPNHGRGRTQRLADAARRHNLFLAAGSVPELGDDGQVHDTALVFDPHGGLRAWHRKAHLYRPTLDHTVLVPGDRLTTFEDPVLGRVGLVVGFDGDFPEVALPSPCAVPGWSWLRRPTRSRGRRRGTSCSRRWPLTNSQWWIQANQAGSHSSSTLLGASRIIAPTGTVVVQASGAVPGRVSPSELLVHRIDLHLAVPPGGGVCTPRGRAPTRALRGAGRPDPGSGVARVGSGCGGVVGVARAQHDVGQALHELRRRTERGVRGVAAALRAPTARARAAGSAIGGNGFSASATTRAVSAAGADPTVTT